ncbi:Mitogen-activated protein kinase kinase kinase 3 [Glycine soja]|uniref:Mitogen-activated protein kinase kinase kinase 3 n=1 Tax=Glycine soja TaxID=3848 RepID=A0A445I2V3_GLYSO|nr:hypothetical protein JHK87_030873 [Glycine soja]KAG4994229.1 hypothetical protein JHK86_031056 [Glycine max]RZB79914.1 Mitogen-activated protein kinase kinase kinase 3 [Glycine soja]
MGITNVFAGTYLEINLMSISCLLVAKWDIKGSNILEDPNGIIKVADFGMAKHVTSSTIVHSFQGTPHWTAPEVILNTSCVGLAVDVWCLGCTIIELATTKPPWSKYKGVAAMFKIANSND